MPEPLADKHGVGIWVLEARAHHPDRWHRSIAFDGYDHELACEQSIRAGRGVREVETDLNADLEGKVCIDCERFHHEEADDA